MDFAFLFTLGWLAVQKIVGMAGGAMVGALIAGLVGIRVADHNSRRDKNSKRISVARALLTEMCGAANHVFGISNQLDELSVGNSAINVREVVIISRPLASTIYESIGHDIGALSDEALTNTVSFYAMLIDFERRVELLLVDRRPSRLAIEIAEELNARQSLTTLAMRMRKVAQDIPARDLPNDYIGLAHAIDAWIATETSDATAVGSEPDG